MLFLISVLACQTYQPTGSMSSVCISLRDGKLSGSDETEVKQNLQAQFSVESVFLVKEQRLMKCEIFTFVLYA